MRTSILGSLAFVAALAPSLGAAAEPGHSGPAAAEACVARVPPVVAKAAAEPQPPECASPAARGRAAALREPNLPLTPAYTPRFLPGFTVTIDRAQAVWSGFVSGVGRSLASGRNCFAEVCGSTGTPLGGSGLPTPGAAPPEVQPPTDPIVVARTLPGGVPDVAGVALGYRWTLAASVGSQPLEFEARAGRNAYRWGGASWSTEPSVASGAVPADAAQGHSLALAVRRGDVELQLAQHRLEFVPRHALATDLSDVTLRRRDARLAWRVSHVQLSASFSESSTRANRGRTERAALLGIAVSLE